MSKAVMQQALDAIRHMCNTTSATYRYDPEIVRKAIEALEEALEDPIEKRLNESQEERLQRVEKGLEWLAKFHVSGGSNPVDFPKFGGCPQQGNLDKADRCATCTCWKSNDIVAVGRLTVALNSNS